MRVRVSGDGMNVMNSYNNDTYVSECKESHIGWVEVP